MAGTPATRFIQQMQGDNAPRLHNMYVVHGDEALQQQEAQDAIRAAARAAGYADRTVFTVQQANRFDWSAVLGAASSMGLFADKQIVEIRIPTGKPGKEGSAALQQLAELAQADQQQYPPESGELAPTLFIISLPTPDGTLKRSAWFKALSAVAAEVMVQDVPPQRLPLWIAERLKRQGHTVADGAEGQQALQYFAQCVEGNLLAAHQAVEKLALTNPPGQLSFDDIVASTSNMARFQVSDVSQALLTGQVSRLQRLFAGLEAVGEQPYSLHWSIGNDIHNLYQIRMALQAGEPLPAAMQTVRAWGSKQRLYERAVQKLSATYLRHMLAAAHIVDGVIKGIPHPDWPQDSWQSLRRLGLTLAQKLAV